MPPVNDAATSSAAVLNAPGHIQSGSTALDQPAAGDDSSISNGTLLVTGPAAAGDGAGAGHALMKLLQRGEALALHSEAVNKLQLLAVQSSV